MPIISVRAIVAHCKLCFIPVPRRSHERCQGPGDSSTILPCEGAFCLIPYDFDGVPIIVLARVETVVNLIESSNAIDKFLCAEMVRSGRGSKVVSFWLELAGAAYICPPWPQDVGVHLHWSLEAM